MRSPFLLIRLSVLVFLIACGASGPAFGQLRREANTTLRLPQSPPVRGYATERAFGTLSFPDPLAMAVPPGETNRLFVVEQRGRISVITNLASPNRTVFLDIVSRVVGGVPSDERGLLGLAFHPGYATNRYFYVYYTTTTATTAGSGNHQRLSRFEASPTNPNLALASSEVPLISQRDQANNHNGGDVHFGPDGYLYVSLGDEGNQDDQLNNSQQINKDFHSGIIRIDVDRRPGSLAPNPHPAVHPNTYAIPPDNPFVGATSFLGRAINPAALRAEFWAVGLRNPWRVSFDSATGTLYCGDVGGGLREEVNIIVKGGNYGWAYREGNLNGPKLSQAPAGFSSIRPIQEYAHGSRTNQGNSVTGGVVYRGDRLSQLFGAYVFADYVSGHIWALRYDGTNTVPFIRLASDPGIAGFGTDPRNGDVLLADQSDDTVKRLIYSSASTGPELPPTLADTGAFADLASLTPQAGIVPYSLNLPFWSDSAIKTRWFSIPDINQTIAFRAEGNWSFPTGAVWIKHFELELTNGVPESRRRLETRFIVRNPGGVYGVTYRWGDSLTNALLVSEEGLDEPLVVHDQGTIRTQVWHYPSRSECVACHTAAGGLGLGFHTAQLNRDFQYGDTAANQLQALSQAGYFDAPVGSVHTLRELAHPTNSAYSLEYRVRSYLAANCVQCHQPGGTAMGFFDTRLWTPTSLAGLIDGPLLNDFGEPENRVVRRGSPERSMLLTRISQPGQHRMPPIASNELDQQAIDLIRSWITNELPDYQTWAEWQTAHFGSTNATNALADADPDGDGARNYLEFLTGRNPLSDSDPWTIALEIGAAGVQIVFPQTARRGFEVQATADLFSPLSWVPLDVPGNRPLFSISNRTAVVEDAPAGETSRFYRVRVYEP